MLRIQTILHPTDFSKTADQALEVAHALARDHNAKLALIAVVLPPPPPEAHYPDLAIATAPIPTDVLEQTRPLIASVASKITDLPVETQVLLGTPGAAIVTAAQDWKADLIVMGTHGRTGISRLLLGSVAEHVLRHAKCPVLTIKPGTSCHLSHEEETALVANRPTVLTTP